ncbi:SURP and G-patch domain-containing protein 1-like protein isoform X3 [Musa acuminata AAA Group]|uniref:SURP and G-patch domain-containing protein 1-like protein isoform X3 n=1 Tax=Musa acuminata AAA Group TaxID=214697 RepID=UPI0031E2B628
MEKGDKSSLFVNDGSFMEKFKQLQQEKVPAAAADRSKSSTSATPSVALKPSVIVNKRPLEVKVKDTKKGSTLTSGGKLAFSLKQKSKVAAAPIKFVTDEEEEEAAEAEAVSGDEPIKRQKLGQRDIIQSLSQQQDVAPSPPTDPAVKKVADKLASFVAKNGRQFENITRQRNPGDTPFKFLFDSSCSDYKYYEYQLFEEEKALAQLKDSKASDSGESSGSSPADPIAMMEFYMKKAAQEERIRQPKQSKDEMPPPASLQAPLKKGHHMGDFIPPEELEKFLFSCNDASAQKGAREAAEKARIQADNIGHRLLSKMGWKEGEGLGSDKRGRADPVMAGEVKKDNLGVGAQKPGEVTADDDIYEQYKKRMMLGYRHRPNPLNNPRKSYY